MIKDSRLPMLLTFAAFGSAIGSHVGALPEIIKAAGVGQQLFGAVNSVGMIGAALAFAIGGWINRHHDHRNVLIFIMPSVLVILLAALLASSQFVFAITVVAFAFGFGLMDCFMNAEASAIEETKKQSRFTTYHAMASLLMAFFAIISSYLSLHLHVAAVSGLSLILFVIAYLTVLKHTPHRPTVKVSAENNVALPRRELAEMGFVMGLTNGCEVAAVLWAGQLLAQLQPQLAAYSGLGVLFYGCCSGLLRLVADELRAKLGDLKLLVGSLGTAIAGFAVLGMSPGFAVSTIAFALVGVGLSSIYPCLASIAGSLVPNRRAAAIGFATAIGGIPRFILPFLFGTISATYAMSGVFSLCALVLATSMLILLFALRSNLQPATK